MSDETGRTYPSPWPRRPPRWATCDGEVDCPTPDECAAQQTGAFDPGSTLHLHRCRESAVETVLTRSPSQREMFVCTRHAEMYEAQGQVDRNPRRKSTVSER